MTDKFNRQFGIGEAIHFKWKNHTEAIEGAGHFEAALGFPGPDLWADIVADGDLAAALLAQTAFQQLLGYTQIKTGIVDKTDMLRAVAFNPVQGAIKQRFKETVVPHHFSETDDRDGGQVIQQLRADSLKLFPAQTGNFEVRLFCPHIGNQLRGMFVTGMLTCDDE